MQKKKGRRSYLRTPSNLRWGGVKGTSTSAHQCDSGSSVSTVFTIKTIELGYVYIVTHPVKGLNIAQCKNCNESFFIHTCSNR